MALRQKQSAAEAYEDAARRVEAQVRHLRAVPADVTDVSRDLMAMDLLNLADNLRRKAL